MADVIIINKIDSASPENVYQLRKNIDSINSDAQIIDAVSSIRVDKIDIIKNKKVLCIEDGPTLTHGEMKIGAAVIAAHKYGASEIVDPRPFAVGKIKRTYERYPEIGKLLPAMGYGNEQIQDLEKTIKDTDCDSVLIGTPVDLTRIIDIEKPATRVYYDLEEIGFPKLAQVLDNFVSNVFAG